MLDPEVKKLAELALKNAFYEDFSALCNHYIAAGAGLDTEAIESQMGEVTGIYDRNTKILGDVNWNCWTRNQNMFTNGFCTLIDALEYDKAVEVHLQNRKIFERQNGKWVWTGDEG